MLHIKRSPEDYSWESGNPLLIVQRGEIEKLTAELVREVLNKDYKPDLIVSIAQSGVFLGRIVARVFNVPHAIFQSKSYGAGEDQAETKHGLFIAKGSLFIDPKKNLVALPEDLTGYYQRILLLDHLVDSGDSLETMEKVIRDRHKGHYEIKTGCLWLKACSKYRPDFIGTIVEPEPESGTMPWIVEPDDRLIYEIIKKFNLDSTI